MESAIIHNRHEQIISQFDCNLGSYQKALALFEISKHLPQYHASIPYFKEYYDEVSAALGDGDYNLYNDLFSERAIAAAKESMVQLSPLAEDKETIPLLTRFTEEMLSDPRIFDYIARSGGVARQTRSNSDGSSSLGPQKVSIEYLKPISPSKKWLKMRD